MRTRRLALAGALVALALTGGPAAARAAVPPDFVGVTSSKHDLFDPDRRIQTMDLQSSIGVGILREPFDWSRIEFSEGRYFYGRYDAVVRDAAWRGLELLPILFDPPSFRSSRPPTGGKRGMYPPSDPAAMGVWAAKLVERYGPNGTFWDANPAIPRVPIRSWQVWNEPSISAFWPDGPDAAEYTALLEAVSAAIRAADPEAEIVAAGLPNSDLGPRANEFLADMYDAGAEPAFDTLAIHPYASDFYDVMAQIHSFRAVATAHGDSAPIWISELGWPTDGPPGYEANVVTEAQQARLVTQTFRAFAQHRGDIGLRGFAYFYFRESAKDLSKDEPDSIWSHVGLIAPDRFKPAYAAFVDVVAEMLERGGGGGGGGGGGDSGGGGDDVAPPREPGGGCADLAGGCQDPAVAALKVTPGTFRAAASGAAARRSSKCARKGARARRGACLVFRVERAAPAVLVRVERLDGGRVVGLGEPLRVPVTAGRNGLHLTGRVGRRALAPGRYRVAVTPLDSAGRRAKPGRRTFRVAAAPAGRRR
ncbi:MAG TPA: glycosyl hydrolase [Thermoleophilaceae bacterium]